MIKEEIISGKSKSAKKIAETLDRNLIIALYDGWKLIDHVNGFKPLNEKFRCLLAHPKHSLTSLRGTPIPRALEDFFYHKKWDDIMPAYGKVIKDFRSIEKTVKSSRKKFDNKASFLKHMDDIEAAINCHLWGVRIDGVFLGVSEAILFINKYKKDPSSYVSPLDKFLKGK